MDKPIFYEGQQVGCLISGEGVVMEIKESRVAVRFKDDWGVDDYFNNGAWLQGQRPTLYPIEQYRAIIETLPAPQPEAWQPKKGEWCWFWDDRNAVRIEQFADYLLPSENYKTKSGRWYRHCAPFVGELPEHLKEVQP